MKATSAIYGEDIVAGTDGEVLVQANGEQDVALSASLVRDITLLDHSFAIEAGIEPGYLDRFGDDAIAGGSEQDEIFGQLGDDTIQGDGDLAKQFDGQASTLVTEAGHGYVSGETNDDGDIVLVVDADTYYLYSEVTASRDVNGDLQVSPSVDVYQIGLILSEALSGTPCVAGSASVQLILAHCEGNVTITDEVEQSLSPQRHIEHLTAPLILAYGTRETPEFQRQTRDFAAAVRAAGKPVEVLVAEGYYHLEVAETLANPYGLLGAAYLAQMGLT